MTQSVSGTVGLTPGCKDPQDAASEPAAACLETTCPPAKGSAESGAADDTVTTARPPGARLPHPQRIGEQHWPPGTRPVVSICCITYNHAPFIRECLDGFLMQETTFPVEILIHDDASTDGTADVIREYAAEYPSLLKPIYQTENQYSKGIKPNAHFNLPRAKGDYLAYCEGDDYWLDKHKLERQVAFLDRQMRYSHCWTRFETLDEKSGARALDKNGEYFEAGVGADFDFKQFCSSWHIGMQTLLFRRSAMCPEHFSNPEYRDVFLVSDLLTQGPGYCLPEVMAVYRVHDGGVYSSKNQLERAAVGSRSYREIFLSHPDNPFLRSKYERFATKYVSLLMQRGAYGDALSVATEVVRLTASASQAQKSPLIEEIGRRLTEEVAGREALQKQLAAAREELCQVQTSLSFRVGRALTAPARVARYVVRRFLHATPSALSVKERTLIDQRRLKFIDKEQVLRDSRRLRRMACPRPPRQPRLIVSLTSYPARIDNAYFTIVSLLQQTTVPDLLLLWLAEEQFPGRESSLPRRIRKLCRLGLTIKWCEDTKSYKKLVPALQTYPDDIIVTADDDLYFAPDWLEQLYRSYQSDPHSIHAHRAHRVAFTAGGEFAPYSDWPRGAAPGARSLANFCTTGAGVLYPPQVLHEDVTNAQLFLRLCPTADDLWFWAMAVLRGTGIRVVENNHESLVHVDPRGQLALADSLPLWEINKQANDRQLNELLCHYERAGLELKQRVRADVERTSAVSC